MIDISSPESNNKSRFFIVGLAYILHLLKNIFRSVTLPVSARLLWGEIELHYHRERVYLSTLFTLEIGGTKVGASFILAIESIRSWNSWSLCCSQYISASLERSSRTRLNLASVLFVPPFRHWAVTFRHACWTCTTCGSNYKIIPRCICYRHESLHKLLTRACTCPIYVLCDHTYGNIIPSNTHDCHVISIRSGCTVYSSWRNPNFPPDASHPDQHLYLPISLCDPR